MAILTDSARLAAYCDHLRSEGREKALRDVLPVLRTYTTFLQVRRSAPSTATIADVQAYRTFLASTEATQDGGILALSTQGTRLGIIRAYHAWMRRRGLAMIDPACSVAPPSVPRKPVSADRLSQQEARALLMASSAAIERNKRGSRAWAIAMRDLAMLAIALTTGRRVTGLCTLRNIDLDVSARSLRVDREKGAVGRVLPVAEWAISVVEAYRVQARPVLLHDQISKWLFPGRDPVDHVATRTWAETVHRLHREASARSTALAELAKKVISTHSLRVSFASMLFQNGCDIRCINELMLHAKLTTTAAYTPVGFEDIRRALIQCHPLAS